MTTFFLARRYSSYSFTFCGSSLPIESSQERRRFAGDRNKHTQRQASSRRPASLRGRPLRDLFREQDGHTRGDPSFEGARHSPQRERQRQLCERIRTGAPALGLQALFGASNRRAILPRTHGPPHPCRDRLRGAPRANQGHGVAFAGKIAHRSNEGASG